MFQLNSRFLLPFLTIGISAANFLFILYVTNFFGVNSKLDSNLLIYGVVLFIGGQLGTLLSNSYIPFIRQSRSYPDNKIDENGFLYGYILLILVLSLFLFFGLDLFFENNRELKLFYSLFLIFLTTNQLVSIRILESHESYVKVQTINILISTMSVIAFYFLNFLGYLSISLSLFLVHMLGTILFVLNDDNRFSFNIRSSYTYLMTFINFFRQHIKVLLCLCIFGLASVLDVFFIKFLNEGDFSLHSLSFRIIVAATSVYHSSFGVIFTNDITKPGISSKQINQIIKNVGTVVLIISIVINIILYFLMDYYFIWEFILNIPITRISYFSISLFYNSLLIFPMLIISYYFRYMIAKKRTDFLFFLLIVWVLIYCTSISFLQMYEIEYLLQLCLNISWWTCLIIVAIKECLLKKTNI